MSSNAAGPATPTASHHPNALLTTREVSELLKVHPTTVARLGIPRIVLGPRIVRLRWRDVQQFLDSKEQQTAKKKKKGRRP